MKYLLLLLIAATNVSAMDFVIVQAPIIGMPLCSIDWFYLNRGGITYEVRACVEDTIFATGFGDVDFYCTSGC